jgi:hypothetical protein
MSRVAFPYPTLFPHIRQRGSWEATIDGNPRFFNEGSGSWDYDSGLEVICRLPWTPCRLFEQAELSQLLAGARLAVVVSTGSSEGTGRRFVATDLSLGDCFGDDNGEETTLRFSLDSACLCNRIKACLYIYSSGGDIGGINLLSGSILYREEATLQLEGDLGSFPVRSLGFNSHNLGNGLWLVRCEADSPQDPLISSITLLLNSDQPSFIEQLQSESEETGLLRWAVRADLVATALDWLLLSEEVSFDVNLEWPDGSVGSTAIEWLRSLGVESQSALQQLTEEIKREPGRFRQRCQAACVLSVEDLP